MKEKMESQPVIEIKNVCFAYDSLEVLHNANLVINQGDMVAVVGPNGGGKSTLLKLILGLLTPNLGTVRVFGGSPQDSCAQIGYVPQLLQFDATFPVSVVDVVLMGRVERSRFGFYGKADRAAALAALAQVHLDGYEKRSFSELSGGERQRVLIAQALASQARILLLDEPTANVDTIAEAQIYALLHEINRDVTIVMVSHNLNVVTSNATHIACVNHTASIVPLAQFNEQDINRTFHPGLAVLHHDCNCPVIDPAPALNTPHKAGKHIHGDK